MKILRLIVAVAGLGAIALGFFVPPENYVRFATNLSPDRHLENGMIEVVEGASWVFVGFGAVLLITAMWWRGGYRAIRNFFNGMLTCPSRSFMIRIVILALLVRLIYALSIEYVPIADWGHYHRHAVDLAAGRGYIRDGQPCTVYPVGWPFFLSILYRVFGTSYTVAKVTNSVLGALTCLVLFRLGCIFYSEKVARSAALLLAVFPSHIYYGGSFATDVLFTLIFFISLIFLDRAFRRQLALRSVALAGFILGLACYVRPVPIAFPVFLVPAWWFSMKRFRRPILAGALLIVVMLVIQGPWTYRNYLRTGRLIVASSNGAVAFWMGHREIMEDGEPKHRWYAEVVEEYGGNPAAGYSAGLDHIKKRPLDAFGRGFKKVQRLYEFDRIGLEWLRSPDGKSEALSPTLKQLLFFMTDVFYYPTLILACIYIILRIARRWKNEDLLLLLVVGYWTFLHFCILGLHRYHFPIVPILILFACESFVRLHAGWLKSVERRRIRENLH